MTTMWQRGIASFGPSFATATLLVGCAPSVSPQPVAGAAIEVRGPPASPGCWSEAGRLPAARANHILASFGEGPSARWLYGLGMGAGRTPADISSELWVGSGSPPRWEALAPPGEPWPARLASQAVGVQGSFLIFGGYTVAQDGHEVSTARVDAYVPATGQWSSRAPMPTPVDDAVALVWRERYVLLVSGWSQDDNVRNTQLYDARADAWTQLQPFPAPGRFGHFGAIAGDTFIICDGVTRHEDAPKYRAYQGCTAGALHVDASTQLVSVDWSSAPDHPGPPRYRAAAATILEAGKPCALVVGGTDNPYNFSGIGYDGQVSEPLSHALRWDFGVGSWRPRPAPAPAVMDLRALVSHGEQVWLMGGMQKGPVVSDRTFVWTAAKCPARD